MVAHRVEETPTVTMGDVAGAVGRGLFAGAVGTAAMTVSSTLEMKLRGREGSSAPADAAAKVLGIEPKGDAEKARFATVVHWAYGSGWGAARGLLAAVGLRGPAAGLTHLGVVWGSELVMLPALEVAPPLKEWGATELAIDGFHHTVYVTATSLAFAFLSRPPGRCQRR
ncbi:MAG: hypothetical protein M3507_03660 [Actinomycetota bacterium]|nr:hypothetical protein [Actinomycetota bacterium]